jgi:ABC-type thiamine transport system ATPase subunit
MARANDAEGLRHAAALREGLQALGWTNGHNVRIDYRCVTGDIDRVNLAKEIVEQQPDVILVESTAALLTVIRKHSRALPIGLGQGPRDRSVISSLVCIENLIRCDCVTESHNVSANGRADILLAERGCLALQVEEPA